MSHYKVIRPTSIGILPRGASYSVKDLGGDQTGYTDLLKKELGVHLSMEHGDTRWVQLHELGHVQHDRFMPGQVIAAAERRLGWKLSPGAVLAALDVRVNELMTRDVRNAHEEYVEDKQPGQYRCDAEGYAAAHKSPRPRAVIGGKLKPEIREAIEKRCAKVAATPSEQLTVWRTVVPFAKFLDELREHGNPERAEQNAQMPSQGDVGEPGSPQPGDPRGMSDDKAVGSEQAAQGGDESAGMACAGHEVKQGGQPKGRNIPYPGWEHPQVWEPELTVRWKKSNRAVTTAENGTQVRWSSSHRIVTDGQIFRRMARRPGALQRGTVLIDISGSMRLSTEDLDTIMNMLPHATVATYSGEWISVLVRDGKRADVSQARQNGENQCDGPALLWLSRMPAPRIWICDGRVTGKGSECDQPPGDDLLFKECGAIMRAAGIVQVLGDPNGPYGNAPVIVTREIMRGHRPNLDDLGGVIAKLERGRV